MLPLSADMGRLYCGDERVDLERIQAIQDDVLPGVHGPVLCSA